MSIAERAVALINELDDEDRYTEVTDEYDEADLWVVEPETIVDTTRWSEITTVVFECADSSFFAVTFEAPATEYQEGAPWNNEAYLVEPYEVTVTKYRRIK